MPDYSKVLSRLQAQCSKSECCSSDILRKATAALEGDSEAARKLVSSLVDDGFVDDLRFASAFAREKSRLSGWGPVKISFMLSGRGIPKDTILQALEQIDSAEADRRMRSVLETKDKSLRGDPQEKIRLLKYALARGYDYDRIAKVVDEIVSAGRTSD